MRERDGFWSRTAFTLVEKADMGTNKYRKQLIIIYMGRALGDPR